MRQNDVERAIDTTLSGLTVTQEQQSALVRAAMASRPPKEAKGVSPDNRVKLKFRFSLSFGLPHMVVAAIVVIVLMIAPLFIRYSKHTAYQSEDEGWYIIQGQETPQEQNAIAEKKALPDGYHQHKTVEEAFAFMGEAVPVPTWIPEGFTTHSADVYVFNNDGLEAIREFSWILVREGTKESIIYEWTQYSDSQYIMTYVEQNEMGEYVTLSNGVEIYCSSNYQYESAVWVDDLTEYFIGGSLTREEAIRMAESVKIP